MVSRNDRDYNCVIDDERIFISTFLSRVFVFSRQQQQSITELMYTPNGPEYAKAQSYWNIKNPNL